MPPKMSFARGLDLFEQVIFTILFVWLFIRLWPDEVSGLSFLPILLLFSEGVVVLFLLSRRRTENISINFKDWLIAFAGTFFALLVVKGGDPSSEVWRLTMAQIGVFPLMLGVLVHIGAKLSLRRSFGIVAADRGVKVGGMYRLIRHPMYLGYMLCHVGYLLFAPVLWNLAVYASSWFFLIARIFAEERVLSENPEYQSYMEKVRYRLLPGVF
jgi:protein-S-isoprenylcysteine O-methyltransferase Ste14